MECRLYLKKRKFNCIFAENASSGTHESLFFLTKMKEQDIVKLANEAISDNESLYLVDITMSVDNRIKLLVDGDLGITLGQIKKISRYIESNLDREEEDFALEVSSPGVDFPIKTEREFNKNKGRKVKIRTLEEKEYVGEVEQVSGEEVTLFWKERVPKEIGKGKVTVEKRETIAYKDIEKAIVQIKF